MRENIEGKLNETEKQFEVQRFNDGNSSLEGYSVYGELMRRLHKEHPDMDYFVGELRDDVPAVAYVAHDLKNEIIGVLNGEKKNKDLEVFWFVIDPEYQNSGVAKELWDMVFSDFDNIRLVASVFGSKNDATEKYLMRRQNALVRYYERIGFKIDEESPFYSPKNLLAGVPMICKK